jgi:hypothetical protein
MLAMKNRAKNENTKKIIPFSVSKKKLAVRLEKEGY